MNALKMTNDIMTSKSIHVYDSFVFDGNLGIFKTIEVRRLLNTYKGLFFDHGKEVVLTKVKKDLLQVTKDELLTSHSSKVDHYALIHFSCGTDVLIDAKAFNTFVSWLDTGDTMNIFLMMNGDLLFKIEDKHNIYYVVIRGVEGMELV